MSEFALKSLTAVCSVEDVRNRNLKGGAAKQLGVKHLLSTKRAFSADIINQMITAAKEYRVKEALTMSDKAIEKMIKKGIQPKLNQLNHHFNWLIDKDYKQKEELKSYDIDFKNYIKYKNDPSLFNKLDENELLNGTKGKDDEELLNDSKGRDDEELLNGSKDRDDEELLNGSKDSGDEESLTGSKGKGDEDEVLSQSNDDEVLNLSSHNGDESTD